MALKKQTLPIISHEDDREEMAIGLNPIWEENPDPYITVMSERGYDLAQPYEIDMYPKSLRGGYYTPEEGAFAFYNAFIKTFHQEPIGEGRPPKDMIIQIQEFVYSDPTGERHAESEVNNPRIWTTKRLYAYVEEHCPAVAAELSTASKFVSSENYEVLLNAMKSTLTVVQAPVRELQVPWGVVKYPGNDSIKIYPTENTEDFPEPVFRLRLLAKKRFMKEVQEFVDAVTHELHHNNLFRGRCFNWNKGMVSYFDPFEATDPSRLIFSRKTTTILDNEILNPIVYSTKAMEINKQLCSQKIILSGPPGTGKTELTNIVAQTCLRNDVTAGYLQPGSNLDDLNKFSEFMAKNSPGMKVIEDIETYMPDTEGMTQKQALEARSLILSIFDGASSKSLPVRTIVTTNYKETLPSAMLRSGRCDVFLNIEAPDREAFEKLVRMHIGQYLPEDIDFDALWREIGNMSSSFLSNGLITKGQKYALKGDDNYKLTPEDFEDMIRSLRDQFDLYEERTVDERAHQKDNLSEAFNDVVKGAISDHEAASVR
jgi:hypothetical protein